MNTNDIQKKHMKYNTKLVQALLSNDDQKLDMYSKKLDMYNTIGEQSGGGQSGGALANVADIIAALEAGVGAGANGAVSASLNELLVKILAATRTAGTVNADDITSIKAIIAAMNSSINAAAPVAP